MTDEELDDIVHLMKGLQSNLKNEGFDRMAKIMQGYIETIMEIVDKNDN